MDGVQCSFGCDDHPEQWSEWLADGEERWATDAALMAEAGFNVVRLAEFAWGLLEPEADRSTLPGWNASIAVLADQDLQIVRTPTPTPPPRSWRIERSRKLRRMVAG